MVWDGGAGTGNWSDATNWSTNLLPPNGSAIQFDGALQTTVNTQADRNIGTLTFNAGASAFTLNNNTLTLATTSGAVLVNNSSALQTINSNLQNSGTVTYSSAAGALLFGGNIAISNSASSRTLTFLATNNITVSGVIANGSTATAAKVTKTGAGTLTLSGANTYAGATTLSAGTLRATTSAAALGAGTLSLTAGTLQLANDTGLNFGRDTTLTGNTTIQSDRLTAGAGVTHTLGALTTGSKVLTLSAGSNVASGTAGLTFGATNVTGNAGFTTGAGTLLTLGALNATVARTLTKRGDGTLLLNAASTNWVTNSALTVYGGTVKLGASNVFGTTALTKITVNANVAGTTAVFDLNNFDQSILTLTLGGTGGTSTSSSNVKTGTGTLTLGGTVTYSATGNPLGSFISGKLSLGAADRTFNIGDSTTAADDLTVSAVISGGAGVGLIKSGAGSLVLTGNNTYTGATSIAGGILSTNSLANVGVSSGLGAPTTVANGTINIGSTSTAGTLLYTGGTTSTDRVVAMAGTTGGATLRNDGPGTLTFTSDIAATGLGAKTLTLRGANTGANTIAGAIPDSTGFKTSLLKADGGTWVIAGNNTYTGTTTVNNGTLRLGSSNSLANSVVTVNSNVAGATALLDLNGFNATVTGLTLGGTGGTATSTSNVATGSGTLTLGGNVTFTATGNPLGSTISGNLALGTVTRTFSVADSLSAADDLTVSAAISGTGGLTKTGSGTLALSGANTYSGTTSVSAGTLAAGAANAFSANSALSVSPSMTVDLRGFDQTVGSLASSAGAALALGSGTLTSGGNNSSTTFAGVASGTGGLTKVGTGTLTLSGVNTYTGTTTVNGGAITLGGSNLLDPSSDLNVGSGGTFNLSSYNQTIGALSGAAGGTITTKVTSGGGTLTVGDATNSTYAGVITGSGSLIKTDTGTLTLTGSNSLSGSLTVDDGTLVLSGGGTLASMPSVVVSDGATLKLDNSGTSHSDRLSDTAAIALNGGTLNFTTNLAGTSETLGALSAGAGISTVLVAQTGAGAGILTFSGLGTIDDSATVNFTATGGTLGASASGPQIYITGLSTGFIGGWAVVGSDFAEYDAYGVRALTGYYTGSDGINVNSTAANVILASSSPLTGFTLTNAGTTKDQSLLLTDVDLVDLNTSASRALNLTSGGLLKTTDTDTVISGAGRLTAGNTAAGTLSVTVQSTGKLTIDSVIVNNAGTDGIYGNAGDGVVKVVKAGAGELILTAANTHTGGTQLDAGTLTVGNDAALGTGAITLNAGTLQTSGGARTLTNSLTLGGNVTLSGADSFSFSGPATLTGTRTLTVNTDTTLSGAIGETGGARGLTKAGTSTLTLSGAAANTYTGTTTVNAGTLLLNKSSGNAIAGNLVVGDGIGTDTVRLLASNQIADSANITVNASGVLDLNNYSDTVAALTVAGGAAITTGTGTLTLGGNVTHTGTGSTAATISGNLALGATTRTITVGDSAAADDLSISANISGSGGLTKAGAGTLVLGGTNTFTGPMTVNAGTVRTDAVNALGTGSALTVAAGATLDLNNYNQTVGSLAASGTIALGSATLTAGGDNSSTTVDGVISGSGGLTKTGTGTLSLMSANTYTGATTINSGTVHVENNTALGTAAGGTTVASGAMLELANSVNLGTEALTLGGNGVGSGGALRSLSGDNVANGAITLTSATTISTVAGTLGLGGALNTAGNALTFASTGDTAESGVISGAGSVTKTGAGDLALSGANTYSGTTTIAAGSLTVTNSNALGTTAGGTVVASGAVLNLNGGVNIGAEALTLSGTGISNSGALQSISGDNVYGGAITLGAATRIVTAADTLTLSGAIDNGGKALTIFSTGDTTISGSMSGAGSLVKTGAGDLVLSGANSYSGVTTITTGTLQAASSTALGSTAGGTTVASGATLELAGGITIGAEALTLAGTGYGSGALVNVSGNNSFGGAITLGANTTIGSADGQLTLNGSGINLGGKTLTFDGDGDFSLQTSLGAAGGFTKTGAGTLSLDSVLSTTGTVVLAGGTLDLGGLAQTIGTLQVTGNSILDFSGVSRLNLTSLSISSGVTLSIVNWSDMVDFFYATNNPGSTVLGRVEFATFSPTNTKWLSYDQQISPVPEPSTYGAVFMGLVLGWIGWRRLRAVSRSKKA
ncbi:autotransporter-associated beta strand repeat-containing protein [Horticoccus luteus]|uniref:Autotransporter-associated beta strand repeat-containing protein n=1 Tax=Horticoccus luteus TaxID=2862869 RepID=A0A8F9TX00_9BACT|nr:autotransporter-associated beta strand repeat-containing protein [Horticoccus luteus]QYM79384.1 autotransporter-associated beta strand repeat-containing protein [Horticoccus luteus]